MRQRIKHFDTEKGASQWARSFDHARKFNRMPALEVEPDEDGARWWVVNPDTEARAKRPIIPMKPLSG